MNFKNCDKKYILLANCRKNREFRKLPNEIKAHVTTIEKINVLKHYMWKIHLVIFQYVF